MSTFPRIFPKTGDELVYTLQLDDPQVTSRITGNLAGMTAFAQIRDEDNNLLFTSPLQAIGTKTEISIRVPSSNTINWEVGHIYTMDFLFSNGATGVDTHTATISIKVQKGIAVRTEPILNRGSFSPRDFSSQDFNTGPVT